MAGESLLITVRYGSLLHSLEQRDRLILPRFGGQLV